jgi:hypothetical protein
LLDAAVAARQPAGSAISLQAGRTPPPPPLFFIFSDIAIEFFSELSPFRLIFTPPLRKA